MIVFVTDELPKPGEAGHLALNAEILGWLRAEGHDVTILLTGKRLSAPLLRHGVQGVEGPHVFRLGRYAVAGSLAGFCLAVARMARRRLPAPLAARLRHRRQNTDAVLGSFVSAADLRCCAEVIARLKPEAVLIDTIFRAPLLAAPELLRMNSIVITHDVFYRRAEALRLAGYAVKPQALTREREAALLEKAQHIAAIQPEEAALLRDMCPSANIFIAPMPAPPCPPPHTARLPGRLVFIGSDTLPNLDGLRWFLADIWPALQGEGITLDLIGDCGPALRQLPNGIVVHGRVKNLAPLLHRAALAISPLRAGSGLKIKMLDYARHGLFTIATPASLAGFHETHGSPFIRAETAEDFAAAILQHVVTPQPPQTPLAYITRHYGRESVFAGLRAALNPVRAP